jgi:hypothetical protein
MIRRCPVCELSLVVGLGHPDCQRLMRRGRWVDRWWWVPVVTLSLWLTWPTFTRVAHTHGIPATLAAGAAGLLLAAVVIWVAQRLVTWPDRHPDPDDKET